MTDNEHSSGCESSLHSSGCESSLKSEFECLEEEEIHLEGILLQVIIVLKTFILTTNFPKMLKFAGGVTVPHPLFFDAHWSRLEFEYGRLCRPNQLF